MLELVRLAFTALRGYRMRTALSMLGIAIGIAAVILLTAIGEGTRLYVLGQFSQFGTNLVAINPGKVETMGLPGVFGGTTQKLTLDDAEALRRVSGVDLVVPMTFGQARVEANGLGRSVYVYGVTADMPALWRFDVALGEFLPAGDPRRGAPLAVLGPTLKRELFGEENALGRFVRAGGRRLRVVGVMEEKGSFLGIDIDDCVYVPVSVALDLFRQDELTEIDFSYPASARAEPIVEGVRRLLTDRHRGREDFTITTQEAMLGVFDNVMNIVTLAVGAIGGISLLVGAIGILTMMWIAVGERTSEIGLVRSLGATGGQVLRLFLAEAVVIAVLGGALGLGFGLAVTFGVRLLVPGLPLAIPPGYAAAALAVSLATGLLSGVLPARRAAALDPIEALRAE